MNSYCSHGREEKFMMRKKRNLDDAEKEKIIEIMCALEMKKL